MKEIIDVAVIGCGYWGPNLVRNFEKLKESRVAVCCDLKEGRLKEIATDYPHIKTTRETNSVFQDSAIDAVAIVTPPSTHFELVKSSLQHEKHVLVEKPFVTSSREAQELVELANKKNRVLMVDHTFIFSTPVEKIKEIIKSEELGKLQTIDFSWLNLGLFQEDNVLWDILPHLVSILLFVLEEKPSSIVGVGKASLRENLIDSAHLIFKYESGLLVTAAVSWFWPEKVRKAVFVGSKKMLIYDDLKTLDKLSLHESGVSFESKTGKYQYQKGNVEIISLEIKETLGKVCAHFVESIKKGKIERSSGQFGLEVIRIIEAAQRALTTA